MPSSGVTVYSIALISSRAACRFSPGKELSPLDASYFSSQLRKLIEDDDHRFISARRHLASFSLVIRLLLQLWSPLFARFAKTRNV